MTAFYAELFRKSGETSGFEPLDSLGLAVKADPVSPFGWRWRLCLDYSGKKMKCQKWHEADSRVPPSHEVF